MVLDRSPPLSADSKNHRDSRETIKALIQKFPHDKLLDIFQCNILYVALSRNDAELVKWLIESKVPLELSSANNESVIHSAMTTLNDEAAKLILALNNLPLDAKDGDGNTPIHLAAAGFRQSRILTLIQVGQHFSWSETNDRGETPLHILARGGFGNDILEDIILYWRDHKIELDVSIEDNQGRTAYDYALRRELLLPMEMLEELKPSNNGSRAMKG